MGIHPIFLRFRGPLEVDRTLPDLPPVQAAFLEGWFWVGRASWSMV